MRVDFYQLSKDPAEVAVAQIAQATLGLGKRMLVVAEGAARLKAIGDALWSRKGTFLANGKAGGPHDARQPILLSETVEPANGATYLALADGLWRECDGFERVFLFFDGETVDAARSLWRDLGNRDGLERRFWKQDGGRWEQAA